LVFLYSVTSQFHRGSFSGATKMPPLHNKALEGTQDFVNALKMFILLKFILTFTRLQPEGDAHTYIDYSLLLVPTTYTRLGGDSKVVAT
jgi:hypothetical protein